MHTEDGWFDPLDLRSQCNPKLPKYKCFKNADGIRGNQHTALVALENLFIRRHNQHALALSKINPHWSDERLYLEARRLLIAEYNHITFSEYLPSLLDDEILNFFNLLPLENGFSRYDPKAEVSTLLEWVTAAGRYGHSQVSTAFYVKNEKSNFSYNLRDHYFEMSLIHTGYTDWIINGLLSVTSEKVDSYFVIDVKDHLYHGQGRKAGLDLIGLNIMRGRDHGIPGYIYFLDFCFRHKVTSWVDLYDYIDVEHVAELQKHYK